MSFITLPKLNRERERHGGRTWSRRAHLIQHDVRAVCTGAPLFTALCPLALARLFHHVRPNAKMRRWRQLVWAQTRVQHRDRARSQRHTAVYALIYRDIHQRYLINSPCFQHAFLFGCRAAWNGSPSKKQTDNLFIFVVVVLNGKKIWLSPYF